MHYKAYCDQCNGPLKKAACEHSYNPWACYKCKRKKGAYSLRKIADVDYAPRDGEVPSEATPFQFFVPDANVKAKLPSVEDARRMVQELRV